jgi:hypothetical protein
MDDSRIHIKVMGESFWGRRSVGKPRGRWKDACRRYAIGLLHIRNWKAIETEIHVWKKEIGEAMARKRVESPEDEEEEEEEERRRRRRW